MEWLEFGVLFIHEVLREFYIRSSINMRRPKQKVKKPTRKQELKKYDEKWSKLVKKRAWNKCEVDGCSKTDHLNSHHIFSRNNYATRFDLDNGVCLCVGHHTFNSHFSAHKTPTEFSEWIIKRGQKWYEGLKYKANQIRDKDVDKIKIYLENKEKELWD